MSIWTRIADAISALAKGEGLSALFERRPASPDRSVAFTIAVIGLGAKMAKADGLVTRNEVAAFREVFHISARDEAQAARVFNLARTDVAGFDVYARRIRDLFGDHPELLCDLMEGLFHIALADGEYHASENAFLEEVARIFGLEDRVFRRLRARFVQDCAPDPYEVLGVTPDMPMDDIRAVWRREVRETHPDGLMARGLPEEAIKMAEKRLVQINSAWEEISAGRAP
ncbi:molecular chaperone DjiA [Anianabacter salinae]|uniref:molecular chaperone DjiA n=1 Tax=Anianabacter salinae TaxID=2851023 RepID=UPI00225E6149|nr:molecular chaperone DjiA [Anianabacter salinae]MBV0913921.1 molecular chaperone DjiA [Anianabacter salinae]